MNQTRKELEERFNAILADKATGSNVYDFDLRRAVALLGKTVIGLDISSSRLAIVNIVLTVVILGVGIVQVCLMLRGK